MKTLETNTLICKGKSKFNIHHVSLCEDNYKRIYLSLQYGEIDGKLQQKLTQIEVKNVGKANETSPLSQGRNELKAKIAKLVQKGYINVTDIPKEDWHSLLEKGKLSTLGKPFSMKPTVYWTLNSKKEKVTKATFPAIVEPKYNGLSSVLDLEEGKLYSKSGLEYYLPHITDELKKHDFSKLGYRYVSGEIYCHGMPLNEINQNTLSYSIFSHRLMFYAYDIMSDDTQLNRKIRLQELELYELKTLCFSAYEIVDNQVAVDQHYNLYLELGFEGLILRTLENKFISGEKVLTMLKLKPHYETDCKVLAITGDAKNPSGILVTLMNDINNNTFDARISGNFPYVVSVLMNKDKYISNLATVRYNERSGVKNVPFQGTILHFLDKNREIFY